MYTDEDLIGHRYGKITVVSYYDTTNYGKRFLCKCDCGNEIIRQGTLINTNRVHSCGCQRGTWNKGKSRKDIAISHIGERYNRLTIIDCKTNTHKNQRGYVMICKCDCGNITKQVYSDLVNGKVLSCGCYQKEQVSKTGSTIGLNNHINDYRWYFIKEGKHINCRSGYEVIYANYLMKNNIKFEYEPKCFVLDDGKRYTPDFYLMDTDEWIELKGTFKANNSQQKDKIKIFKQTHKHKILFWEDIVKECSLPYKTYNTFLNHADREGMAREDYLAKLVC